MTFRSLEEIYLQECAGKEIPPLSRHTIVERYKIVLKDEDQVSVDQEISPEMYNKIRREVSRTTVVDIDDKQYSVDQVIDMILRIDAWDKGNPEYKEKFLAPVANVFNHADINPKGFAALYKLQTNQNNKLRNELIQNPGTTRSLYQLIPSEFIGVFNSEQDARSVFDMLYNINPSIANVSVGRGEVALSFISDAIKGDKGDLEMSGIGEVEIKGDGARLGGDGHAVDRSVAAINSILQLVGTSLSNVEVNQLKQTLYKSLETMLREREQATRSKTDLSTLKYFNTRLKNDFSVDEILKDIQLMAPSLGKTVANELVKHVNYIRDAQAPERAHTLTDAIRLFFSMADQMPYEKFVDGVLSLRSYYMPDRVGMMAEAIKNLIPESEYTKFTNPKLYEPLVASMHLFCYLLKERFANIVFLNDRDKNAICFKSQGDESSNLKAAFEFFSQNNFKFRFSVDPARKSVSVTFNG